MTSRRTVSREIPSRRASCAAVRKSAACSVSGGGGRRGGGISATARARATILQQLQAAPPVFPVAEDEDVAVIEGEDVGRRTAPPAGCWRGRGVRGGAVVVSLS